MDDWIFVTESPSWFVWRKDNLYKNLNKHTGEVVFRKLTVL